MKKLLIIPLLLTIFLAGVPVHADTPGGKTNVGIKIENPFKFGNNLYQVLQAIVENIIIPIGGILCVLAFIYSGFQYVTSGGDTKKIADASRSLLYAAIGTALLLGAWVIAGVVQTTINSLR